MKKFLWNLLSVVLVALMTAGCAKETDLGNLKTRIDDLDSRVTALEEAVNNLNNEVIPNLQRLVNALNNQVTVVSVVAGDNGTYTITFSDGTVATIKDGKDGANGKDGKDGVDGKDGKDGVDGKDGKDGTNGKDGTDGKDGVDGKDGKDGVDGKDGKDGVDGTTPTVSIAWDETLGTWVWVINGEIAKDGEGNPVPVVGPKGTDGVDGVTPKFAIMTDPSAPDPATAKSYWMVSYDDGQTWNYVGLADTGSFISAYIDPDQETEDYIVLVVGETSVQIPKEKAFSLVILYDGDLGSVGANAGDSISLQYEVSGVSASDELTVDILSASAGIEAKVVYTEENKSKGYFIITIPDAEIDPETGDPIYKEIAGKVFVFADNNKGKSNIKVISIEEGVITAVANVDAQVPSGGDTISMIVSTNKEFNVMVSDGAESWLSVAETKVPHTVKLEIVVAPNTTGAYRVGTVTVTDSATGETVDTFTIVQQPSDTEATDLGSIRELEDGTQVAGKDAVVVAASKEGALVVDENGAYLYIELAENAAVRGDVVSFEGVKKTNAALDLKYVEATSVTVSGKAEEVVDLDWVYIGYGENYNSVNTGATGILHKEAESGAYYVSTQNIPTIYLETPSFDVDLAALEGKYVNIKGYTNGVFVDLDEDWNFVGYYVFIANSIEEVTFEVNPNWTLSDEGEFTYYGYNFEDILNTVSAGEDYFANGYMVPTVYPYPAEGDMNADEIQALAATEALRIADDVQYYFTRYTETIEDEAINVTGSLYPLAPETYGKFIVFATGLTEEGYASGKYAYVVFEKKDPHVHLDYKDFLGKWVVDGKNWEIKQKEEGVSYTVNADLLGLKSVDLDGLYVDGKFAFMETHIGAFGGYTDLYLSGESYSSADDFFGYGVNYAEPQPIFIVGALDDGTFEVTRGTYDNGTKVYTFNYIELWNNDGGFNDVAYAGMPSSFEAYVAPPSADYKDYLGQWNVPTTSGNSVWTIAPLVENETYAITGMGGLEQNGAGEPLVVEAVYTEEGTLSIPIQMVSDNYTEGEVQAYDLLSGIYNSGYLSTTIGTEIAVATIVDGNLNLTPAMFNGYKFESLTFFHRTSTWGILGARTPLPGVGTPAGGEVDPAYEKWLGTWTVTEANSGTYNITIVENVPGESYLISGINGFNYSWLNANADFDPETKSLLLCGGNKEKGLVATNVGLGQTQNFNLYLLCLIQNGDKTYRITGNYYLAQLSFDEGDNVVFTPGTVSVNFGDGSQPYPIVAQRIYAFGMDDSSVVYTLNGEVVSYYPLEIVPAANSVFASGESGNSQSLSIARAATERAAKATVTVSKTNASVAAKKPGATPVAKSASLVKGSYKFTK